MTARKRPKKRVPPLGHIVFPKSGPPRKEIESLPKVQKPLEVRIIEKFAGALHHFEGRTLNSIEESDPWPDFTAREGDTNWAIELIELVEPTHVALAQLQESYHDAIVDELGEIPEFLDGIDVLVDDNYQEPRFPKLESTRGKKIVSAIANELNSISEHLRALPVEGIIIRDLADKQDVVPHLRLACWRFAPPGNPGKIRFSGTFPIAVNDANHLLERTIVSKLKKHYQRLPGYELLLLIYELRMISVEPESPALTYARDALQSRDHPFSEVWYLFPYAHQDLGHLVRVWPV